MPIYGRALNPRVYGAAPDDFEPILGQRAGIFVSNYSFTIPSTGLYRIYNFARGGNGGAANSTHAGGGGSRGNIGISDIQLNAGDKIEWGYPEPNYMSTIWINGTIKWQVGTGQFPQSNQFLGAPAPLANIGDFNVLNFNASAGEDGQAGATGLGGKASIFNGDLSIVKYTNSSTQQPNLGSSATNRPSKEWILGLGNDGGNAPNNANRTLIQQGGIIIERYMG